MSNKIVEGRVPARIVSLGVAAAVAGVLCSFAAIAGPSPQTDQFQVLAQVPARCVISSSSDMDFGLIDPEAVNTANSSIDYRCTNGTQPSVELDYSGTMTGSGGTLGYTLFSNAARTVVWKTGPDAFLVPVGTGLGNTLTATVYGQITVAQAANAGVGADYAETVDVTFNF
jgi:spore coat protein U-like protein